MTLRAWFLSSRAENESLGGGRSHAFFAAMRLGEDLGYANHLDSAPGQDILVAYVRRAKSDSRYPQRGENAIDI